MNCSVCVSTIQSQTVRHLQTYPSQHITPCNTILIFKHNHHHQHALCVVIWPIAVPPLWTTHLGTLNAWCHALLDSTSLLARPGENEATGKLTNCTASVLQPPSEPSVQLACKHLFHSHCIQGWTMVGKKDCCPTCMEKVDLRELYKDRPWETSNLTW